MLTQRSFCAKNVNLTGLYDSLMPNQMPHGAKLEYDRKCTKSEVECHAPGSQRSKLFLGSNERSRHAEYNKIIISEYLSIVPVLFEVT